MSDCGTWLWSKTVVRRWSPAWQSLARGHWRMLTTTPHTVYQAPGGNPSPEGLRTAGSYFAWRQNYLAQMAVILKLKNAVSS